MTIDEAKKILEAYIACESKKAHFECDDYNCDDNCPLRYEMGTVGEYNEAINMAIEALEQQPCEDEYIKGFEDCRQAVLNTLSELNAISFYEAQEDSKECYYEIRQAVKNMPPVTQQPKTGHWEYVQYDYNPKLGNWHCSECRCVVVECVNKEEKGGIPSYKYCPQCGTKMIELQAESDRTCRTCKHYTSGQRDGSCGSYICKNYSDWESEE